MENRSMIIILVGIIVILVAVLGVMFSMQMAKEKSNLTIVDKTINVGDSLTVVLTDNDGNQISNETINVKFKDKSGKTISKDITTNSKGKAKYKMEEEGNYSVECSFKGNGQYASTSVTDNVTIENATTQLINQEQTSTNVHSSKYAPNGGIYPEYGPEVDHYGKTREFAIANNWHYVPLIIDGEDVGGYTAIDPNTGYYHS